MSTQGIANMLLPSSYVIPDWAVFTGLFLLVYLTVMLSLFRNKFQSELQAVFNVNLTRRLFEISNPDYTRFAFSFNLLFFLEAGIFLRYVNLHFGTGADFWHPVTLMATMSVAVMLVYAIKIVLYRIVGFLTRVRKAVAEYIFNFFMLHRFLALIIIPLVFLQMLVHPVWKYPILIASGVVGGLWLLFLAMRLFMVLRRHRIQGIAILFFFLVIELLPMALLIRIIYNLILRI